MDKLNLLTVSSSPWSTILKDEKARVCVKVCHHDVPPHSGSRELAILASLKNAHPNILHLLSHDRKDGAIRMELPLYDDTLLPFLKASPQSIRSTAQLLAGVADGLAFLHDSGILHRDINPSNILIQNGERPQAVICDFGVSWQPSQPGCESKGQLLCEVGTGPFRAPELLFGMQDYDQSIDLWALGTTIAQAFHPNQGTLFNPDPSASDLQLIASIFKTLGTPSPNLG
ncbi:kinase-like domain-containing protein [Protomyces lactucae-debilis]|uniref:Kinase-like domain-containing protein n=1 Tax=Protomyces lactucae-debilis TaxID=2754530 RepID=A0A1Y2F2Y8_PROLT|nr:kinase-like domain-containing protein [Protomyces lactucae-debilis]ORY78239.1 kinase-like domain-containing protein [Protomyces lactucae-debilis]